MDRRTAAQIIHDHKKNGLSYRRLVKKYGIPLSSIYRMLKKEKPGEPVVVKAIPEALFPDDVSVLKEALRKAHLKIELQDLMLDISSEELGIDLRKKHGTRQSK